MLDVNSAIAVEKEIAADTIGSLFAETQAYLLPWVEQATLVLVDLLPHYYEGIRKAASSSLLLIIRTFYDLSDPAEWQPGLAVVSHSCAGVRWLAHRALSQGNTAQAKSQRSYQSCRASPPQDV
jgi:hypothetical protein